MAQSIAKSVQGTLWPPKSAPTQLDMLPLPAQLPVTNLDTSVTE